MSLVSSSDQTLGISPTSVNPGGGPFSVKTILLHLHALLESVRIVIVSLRPTIKGVELSRCAFTGMGSIAVGVSEMFRAVGHQRRTAGVCEVTVKLPTLSGRGGYVFPGTIVSRFLVAVMFNIDFLVMRLGYDLFRYTRRAGRRDTRRTGRLRVVKRLLAGKRRDRMLLGGKTISDVDYLAVSVVGKAELL